MTLLRSHEEWRTAAAGLTHPTELFIGGEFVAAANGQTAPAWSPRDGATLAQVEQGGPVDVDRAVAAARRAFDDGPWPRLAPRARAAYLHRLADLLERDTDDLALTISLEMGKPINDAVGIELPAVARVFRWYAELADKEMGEISPTDASTLGLVTREPTGVVAAVVPWNFPLTMAAWKLAPALVSGCTVVLKPAEQAPLSALRLARLVAEAGLPPGVVNVVNGSGPVVGRALGVHRDVDVVAFTGSADVGREFLRYAADSNLKRVWLELGGKSANIVLADAPDLEVAADTAAWGCFFNAGQMCTAASRLIVERRVVDEVVERVASKAASDYEPADPLDPATKMGPVVGRTEQRTILNTVDAAVRGGATLRTGGVATRADSGGTYLAATVLEDVQSWMHVARVEVFGPVLSVLAVDDEAQAVRVAEATDYGLAAAVWTRDLGAAHRVSRALRAGTVWVNCYEEGDLTVPFGGMKLSGHGRDKSRHALDKFTDLKTTWIALP